MNFSDKTSEIVELASQLIRIPSVTACPEERLSDVRQAAEYIADYLLANGLSVRGLFDAKYPAILAGFPGGMPAVVMLSGHFDVVAPEPDDRQFEPVVDGDYLIGRGAADMKTVVATYMVWMKDMLLAGPPYPPVNLMLVGNEENGEAEPTGTPHMLKQLQEEYKDSSGLPYAPKLFIAGERTGEGGHELWGEICTQNRGIMRFEVVAHGARGHSGVAGANIDLTNRLLAARADIQKMLESRLTLKSQDGWQSQVRYPFVVIGTPGIFNITPDHGHFGAEVRPIPQDDIAGLSQELASYCQEHELELIVSVLENGIICNPDNPYLEALVREVRAVAGSEPVIGRKLPGTSARFAPGGQGVVWGQSGIGPHAANERHHIPSIAPYYKALNAYALELIRMSPPDLRQTPES
jgi:acetylornithine deacetylase/succinyl-diaminopimelate desuccinylase-like protein